MRSLYFILVSILLLTSCEIRKCECREDIMLSWKDDIKPDSLFITIPNAVLNVGLPLGIEISFFQNQMAWELKSANIYKDNVNFINTEDLISFIKDDSFIEFPHEIFSSTNSSLITGPVNIDIEIFFPDSGAQVLIEGTIYFYSCEDINDDFNGEECRWPRTIFGTFGVPSC